MTYDMDSLVTAILKVKETYSIYEYILLKVVASSMKPEIRLHMQIKVA